MQYLVLGKFSSFHSLFGLFTNDDPINIFIFVTFYKFVEMYNEFASHTIPRKNIQYVFLSCNFDKSFDFLFAFHL